MNDKEFVVGEHEGDEFDEIPGTVWTDHEDLRRRGLGIKINDSHEPVEGVSGVFSENTMFRRRAMQAHNIIVSQ